MRRPEDCDEMLPPPARTTLGKLGRYTVSKKGKPDKFWPLDPDQLNEVRSVFPATADVMPTVWGSDFSTLVLPPQYGIFDIIIHFSDDAFDVTPPEIEADKLHEEYSFPWLMGRPTATEATLAADEFQNAHIAFAVYIEQGKSEFEGKVQFEAKLKSGQVKRIEFPIKVKKFEKADDLFVFFICHKAKLEPVGELPKTPHTWCKLRAVTKNGKPVEDAVAQVQVLRDNLDHGYKYRNRRVFLYSQDDGYLAAFGTRKVIGLPLGWPLIFNLSKNGYVMRGHMLKLENADIKNNLEPFAAPATRTEIPMLTDAEANLSAFKFLLDPGHGVVYAVPKHRRSQEWLSANILGERIAALLTSRFNVPETNIYWTRTAGFGLIAPDEIDDSAAPENGFERYDFELTNPASRRIRVASHSPDGPDDRLLALSDLLSTTHADNNSSQPVPDERRSALLQLNPDPIQNATALRLTALNLHWRISSGSFDWDTDLSAYSFTIQRRRSNGTWVDAGTGSAGWDAAQGQFLISVTVDHPTAPETAALNQPIVIQINHSHWLTIDDTMMRTLEDRSARWSIQSEIGTDKHASQAVTNDWLARTRAAMVGAGALEYMKQKIRWSNDRPAGDELLAHGVMGWHFTTRWNYFNKQGAPWNLIVTIHENANLTGIQSVGFEALISENAPPAEQVQIAKTFVKYVDPFDQGTFGGGVAGNSANLVNAGDHRKKHIYLELEFMDTHIGGTPDFQYRDMLSERYLETVSNAVVAGIVEWLLLKQDRATFDAIKYTTSPGLW